MEEANKKELEMWKILGEELRNNYTLDDFNSLPDEVKDFVENNFSYDVENEEYSMERGI
jgi:hypothetical protein